MSQTTVIFPQLLKVSEFNRLVSPDHLYLTIKMGKKRESQGFKLYNQRVLKQVHPNMRITGDSEKTLNRVITIIANHLSQRAWEVTLRDNRVTLDSRSIQTAIKMALPGELLKQAVDEGTKHVTKYNVNQNTEEGIKTSKSARIGLTYSSSLVRRFLKNIGTGYQNQGVSSLRVGGSAAVYLTAVLEYLSAEILELSGNQARDEKRVTIKVRNIMFAVRKDSELDRLFENLNILLLKGGVVPEIKEVFQKTKMRKVTDKGKKKRFRPGAVAVRKIKEYQGEDKPLIRKAPFERLVRKWGGDSLYGKNVVDTIQRIVEKLTVQLLRDSLEMTLHAGRTQVNDSDLMLARRIGYSNFPTQTKKVTEIGESDVAKLAYQAGIKLKTGKLSQATLSFIGDLVNMILTKSLVLKNHFRLKTLSLKALRMGMESTGYQIA